MMYITPKLETERLILKRGTVDDYLRVYEYNYSKLLDKEEVKKEDLVPCDPEKIKTFCAEVDESENMLDFIIYLKDGTPIGNLVFDRYDSQLNSLTVSINIHYNYWGNGYAKEAIVEAMRYVFDKLNIDNVIYGYIDYNKKSERACEKIGFDYYGKTESHSDNLKRDIVTIINIMSKDKFMELYGSKTK